MTKIHYARVNAQKEIVLPHHMAKELGIVPGDELRIESNGHGFYIHPSINALKKVYIELTNKCNLSCSTCMRNGWDVDYGQMSTERFEQILVELETFQEKPELFLGGYGERAATGVHGKGPQAVVTNLGILEPDATGELVLTAIHPGVAVEQVAANTGWDLKFAPDLRITDPVTEDELRILREELDPHGIYLKGS